jgi:hypothetical protein
LRNFAVGDRLHCRFPGEVGGKIETLLTVLGQERVDEDGRGDAVQDVFDGAGRRDAAVRMGNQHDTAEILSHDQVHDVGDVAIDIDVRAQQMRTLAKTGQGRRKGLMTAPFKQVRDAAPAPATVPGAVNQNECL